MATGENQEVFVNNDDGEWNFLVIRHGSLMKLENFIQSYTPLTFMKEIIHQPMVK
jgi:hypothetical protein